MPVPSHLRPCLVPPFHSLTSFQPKGSSRCSLDTPSRLLPRGLCTCSSPCPEHSPIPQPSCHPMAGSLTAFSFPDHSVPPTLPTSKPPALPMLLPALFPSVVLIFIQLPSFYLLVCLLVCLPGENASHTRTGMLFYPVPYTQRLKQYLAHGRQSIRFTEC